MANIDDITLNNCVKQLVIKVGRQRLSQFTFFISPKVNLTVALLKRPAKS